MSRQGKVDWNKAFPISHVTREDLVTAGFPRWKVAGLSDDEVVLVASRMGDMHTDCCYHEAIIEAAEYVSLLYPKKNINGELV